MRRTRLSGYCYRLGFALFHTRCLTLTTAQVEQPRPAYLTQPYHLNFIDIGRQQRENPLYADTVGDFADGERLASTVRVPALDDRAGKNLNAFLISFADFDVYVHRITRPEYGQLGTTLRIVCLH